MINNDNNPNNIRKLLNHFLKKLFFKVLSIQEKHVNIATKNKLSRTEIHVVEVVRDSDYPILTEVASKLNISKATASVSIERLVKKGFLVKKVDERDKRKQFLALTDLGETCYRQHEVYHEKMVDALLTGFKIHEYPELLKGLKNLSDFLDTYESQSDED